MRSPQTLLLRNPRDQYFTRISTKPNFSEVQNTTSQKSKTRLLRSQKRTSQKPKTQLLRRPPAGLLRSPKHDFSEVPQRNFSEVDRPTSQRPDLPRPARQHTASRFSRLSRYRVLRGPSRSQRMFNASISSRQSKYKIGFGSFFDRNNQYLSSSTPTWSSDHSGPPTRSSNQVFTRHNC